MTQEQLDEYQPVLKVPMKVLKKTGDFCIQSLYIRKHNTPLVISYGGNLIYNRYKTLAELAVAIRKINKHKICIILNIYTQTTVSDNIKDLLHDGKNTFLNGKVTLSELENEYKNSDLVLHVESFDLKQRLLTKLSFSTKIIDLLHSGRCVLAICWKKSSPYKYLKSEDAAICIDDTSKIEETLQLLIKNPRLVEKYANKAWICGKKNHDRNQNIADLKKDFESLIL